MDCWKSIGIAGSSRGSGATHLSVALANYAASGLGEKTAYLELNGHKQIGHWKNAGEDGYFQDLRVHYYPNLKKEEIPIILNRDYDRVIMDFGDAYASFREDLLRCGRKVFLLNLSRWQKFEAEKMINSVQRKDWGGIQPVYASVNAQKEIKREIERKYGTQIESIPLLPDPGRIHSNDFACMELILGYPAAKVKRKKSLIPFRRKK